MRKFLLFLLLALPCFASTSTLTGTINDPQGNGLNGLLYMTLPVPAQDMTTNTAVAPGTVVFRLANGQITGGAALYDVATLQPQNLYYKARAYDVSGNLVFYGNYVVTGASFNLGAAVPTSVTTSNVSYLSPVSLTGTNIFTGNNSFTNLNAILFADQFASVQAAINALPSTGGYIMIKPGTYVGPTGIPSHVHLMGYVPGPPAATLTAATNFVLGTVPADQKVIFTYTGNLTLSGLYDTTIENITLDFGGSNFGVILQNGVFYNNFDIVIQNCGTAAALTLNSGAVAGQAVVVNDFKRLDIFNAGKGIVLTGTAPGASGNNTFRHVIINNISVTGVEFTQQADTNSFDFLFIAGLANTAKAIVFNNSGTPNADVDANDNVIRHLIIDAFNPPTYTGTLITFNQSMGNLLQGITIGGGLNTATEVATAGLPNYTLEYAADFTNATNSNTMQAKRFIGTGTLHTTTDYLLSAGWGTVPVKGAVSGTDIAGTISVTAGGAGIAANPTITINFRDGTWGAAGWGSNSPICVVSRAENSAPTTAYFATTSTTLSTAVVTFFGLPVAANSYTLDYVCMGTAH